MRFALLLLITFCTAGYAYAGPQATVIKVLQHLEDHQKRIALSPSLYERDAYQAHLRQNPEEVSALRFEVYWKAEVHKKRPLKLRMEVVTENNTRQKPAVFEEEVFNKGLFRNWTTVRIDKSAYQELGRVISWRATLWDGENLIAHQNSFLWESAAPTTP